MSNKNNITSPMGENRKGASIVILADGDYPASAEVLTVLNNATHVICCDNAGMEYIRRTGKRPYAIVGDGDSLPEEFKRKYADIYHHVSEQDYNDLTKATRFAIQEFGNNNTSDSNETFSKDDAPLSIVYLGTTGKREDHTIGNISLMAFYRREFGITPLLYTDYGFFTPCVGEHTFRSFAGQQVSIFNLSSTELTGSKLKWAPYPYKELWQGTLNESTGDEFTITANGEYIVYQTHC